MFDFLSGLVTGGFLIAAVFFFRFWKRTEDSLFAIFGISFVLFALNQGATLWANSPQDDQGAVYLLRLTGFVLLLIAIAVKNFKKPEPEEKRTTKSWKA